jgi:hypothetical protein
VARFKDIERAGLALPGVVLHPHMGQPSLRANGRMFALWWEPDKTAILKLEREHQHMLFEVRPDVFAPCKVGTGTWSYVDVAKLETGEIEALVREAWMQVMPKKARAALTSSAAEPPSPSRRSRAAAPTDTGSSPSSRARRRRR